MTTTQNTAGQASTAALRYYLSLGTRTPPLPHPRRTRMDLHAEMIEAVTIAATLPGAHSERLEKAMAPGFGAALAYEKHVGGYRIGTLAYEIQPHERVAVLGPARPDARRGRPDHWRRRASSRDGTHDEERGVTRFPKLAGLAETWPRCLPAARGASRRAPELSLLP